MVNVSNNVIKDTSNESITAINIKSKDTKPKIKTFDQVLKKNVSNSDNSKQSKLNNNMDTVETDDVNSRNREVIKKYSNKDDNEQTVELKESGFDEQDFNYLSQLLGINKTEFKEIIDKLCLGNNDLDINSPKIDLYMIIKENLKGQLDEPSLKLFKLLNEHMDFDVFSLEQYKNSSNNEILDFLKVLATIKDNSLVIDNASTSDSINKYGILNENLATIDENFDNIKEDANNVKDEFKGTYSRPLDSNEDTFLKSLLEANDNSKSLIDESKVNITIDKFNNMVNKDLSNDIVTNLNIGKEDFDYGIVKSMKFMDLSNMKELSLKIIPKELGEIIIRVTLENNILKANIKPTTKEGYELLQNNLNSIKEKLANSSIKIQEFSVDIYDKNSTASNSNNFKENSSDENKQGKIYDSIKGEADIEQLDNSNIDIINDMVNMLA